MAGHRKIPNHLIFFHILPRLPIDSLQRCKRVCKQWHSFLKTLLFANMHNRHVTNGSSTLQLHSKLLFLPSFNVDVGFRIMDCEAPDDGLIAHCHPLPFEANICSIDIRTSLHGLVCLGGLCIKRGLLEKEYYSGLVLWNPLTGEHRMLCKTNNPHHNQIDFSKLIALGLYYRDDDYKLLCVSSDLGVHIYSLKSDSWRKVDDSTNNYQTLFDLGLGSAYRWTISSSIWSNGNLYFLKGYSVLKFDTKMEKFTIIPNHPSLETLDIKRARINVQKGVIHLGVKYETGSGKAYIQLWRLIGDETWEKVYVGAPCKVDIDMDPLHWIGKKNWLMIGSRARNDRFLYKYKVDHHSKNYANGKSARIFDMYEYAEEVLNYTETFMSIDRSI